MQIDELVVKLVLDATGFGRGQKDASDATGRLKQSVMADAKATEASVAKVTAGVEALGRRFLGLYALVTAGRGLREFVSDLTSTDSALGRTARNIDLSAKALSTWQLAAEASGGSAAGITGTMRSLSGELQRAALTGTSSVIPAFKALQINLADTKGHARDVRDILTDMNRRAQGMDPAKFTALANLAGISDEGTINLLEKSTAEFDKLIAAQEKFAATQADVDAAQKRQSGWRELLITSTSIGRTILTAVTPAIVDAMKAVQGWADANQGWIRTAIVEKVGQLADYLKGLDWGAIGKGVQDFTNEVRDIVKAADDASKGFDSNSLLWKGLEAMGALIGVRVLGSVVALTTGLGRLAAIPVTGLLARILMNPVGLTATALTVGGLADAEMARRTGAAMNDPNAKFDPETGFVNDLDFGFGKEKQDSGSNPQTGAIAWFKSLFGGGGGTSDPVTNTDSNALHRNDETPAGAQRGGLWDSLKRLVGFGDDPKVKASVETTAKATTGIFDLMRNGAADALGGVTSSSGGIGGSGQHVDGSSGAGARLGDRGQAGRGAGPSALKNGQQKANAAAIADEMRKTGMSDEGIAAVLGSMQTESGFSPRAHNDVAGGHTGLWQWDARRWAKVRGWIEKQGGDPWDARWQAKAFIAEGRAKPGDAIYDNGNTSGGFDDIMGAKGNMGKAVHGVQRSERFGVGEEGGRAANAGKWLGHLPGSPETSSESTPVTDGQVAAARTRLVGGGRDPKDHALIARYLKEQNTPPAEPRPNFETRGSDGQVYHTADMRDPRFAPPHLTAHHLMHAALGAIGHASRLTHHDGKPVAVTYVDKNGLAPSGNPLADLHRWRFDHALKHLGVAEMSHLSRLAAFSGHGSRTVHNVDNRSDTRIASMTVHTRAENGRELAADLEKHLARNREVAQSNSGLA